MARLIHRYACNERQAGQNRYQAQHNRRYASQFEAARPRMPDDHKIASKDKLHAPTADGSRAGEPR